MSAFLCSDEHINALVTFANSNDVLQYYKEELTAQEAGQLLYDQNVRSLVARYGEGEYENAKTFEYVPDHKPRSAIEIIKLCHCYDYQACETEDWGTTKAYKLIKRIESAAIYLIPGYDAAPWGI